MGEVLLALLPLGIAAVWRFGIGAAGPIVVSIAAACAADWICDREKSPNRSSVVIGAIFSLLLPVQSPWWLAALGSAIAVFVGKHAFGGMGQNTFNPAAVSRTVLMGALPAYFFAPSVNIDGISSATPLSKEIGSTAMPLRMLLEGGHRATLAEAAPWVVMAVGVLLVSRQTIDWRTPLTYLSTIALLAFIMPAGDRTAGHAPWLAADPLLHIVSGGSLFVAFFMLTDPVTGPFTALGRVAAAALAGFYTMIVRFYTPYPDGAVLAVLLTNAVVPLLDKYTLRTE